MAFSDPITVLDRTATGKDFVLQSRTLNGSDYVEETASASDQRKILVRHQNAGPSVQKGAKAIRRHLVQFVDERYNATLGKQERAVLNVTLTIDPGSSAALTGNGLADLAAFASNFFDPSGDTLEKLLRDES
jgi:hypothetical protein